MPLKADRPLFATADGQVVEEGDPRAAVQIASRAGKGIPKDYEERYPVRKYMRDNPLAQPGDEAEPEEKAQKGPPEDKSRRAAPAVKGE